MAAGQSHLLVAIHYLTGPFGFVTDETLGPFTQFVQKVDLPFKLMVIVLETGGFFVIVGRRKTIFPLLVIWTVVHLSVALLSDDKHGAISSDDRQVKRVRRFFEVFLQNYNERGSRASTFRSLKPPPILWRSPVENDYLGQESLTRVTIYHQFSLWDGAELQRVDEGQFMEVDIPRSEAQR